MYELFVDNQRFFRRYFSLSDLAEDKRALLRDVLREEGGDEGIRVSLSLSLFLVPFSLSGEQRVGRWLKSRRKLP